MCLCAEVDELAPADSLWTTQRDAAVKLRLKASGPGSETPVTIPSFFKSIVARNPNGVAMGKGECPENWTCPCCLIV